MDDEKKRRHLSIARDIERERWRRQQLGLPADDADDGFAKRYVASAANASDVVEAKRSIDETIRIMHGGKPELPPPTLYETVVGFMSGKPVTPPATQKN